MSDQEKVQNFGKNFPVSDSIRSDIVDARTISRSGQWWTAVLLFRNSRTDAPYIALYKWNMRNGSWKKASSFKINTDEHLAKIVESLGEFKKQMEK